MTPAWPLLLAPLALACGGTTASADLADDVPEAEWVRVSYGAGKTVDVFVIRPVGYVDGVAYPVVVALPWGGGTADLVLSLVDRYWDTEAPARGYIVVAPEVLGPSLDTEAEALIPAIFDWLGSTLSYDPSRVVLTGASNGGRGVFHAAIAHPDRFAALIGMPGEYRGSGEDLAGLSGKRAWLLVGEADAGWRGSSEGTRDLLEAQGVETELEVLAGQGHVLSIAQTRLMDWIDEAIGR